MSVANLKSISHWLRHLFRSPCALCARFSDGAEICAPCSLKLHNTPWGASGLSIDDHRITVLWREPYGGPLTQAIYRAKFAGSWGEAQTLGLCLGQLPRLWMGPRPVLLPIALSANRLAERGFNQSTMIGIGLGRAWGLEVQKRWLKKIRPTARQVHLDKSLRKNNLSQSFVAREHVRGRHILLVDDVMTTGATLREAGRAVIAAGGILVGAVVVARAQTHQANHGDLKNSSGKTHNVKSRDIPMRDNLRCYEYPSRRFG